MECLGDLLVELVTLNGLEVRLDGSFYFVWVGCSAVPNLFGGIDVGDVELLEEVGETIVVAESLILFLKLFPMPITLKPIPIRVLDQPVPTSTLQEPLPIHFLICGVEVHAFLKQVHRAQ
jgi:hypothetical protein